MTTYNPEESRERTSENQKHHVKDVGDKLAQEHAGPAARDGETRAKDMVGQAKQVASKVVDETGSLLHEARDAATDSYRSARDFAIESADEVGQQARRIGSLSVDYARRAGGSTAEFVSANALPLTLIGIGAGWLTWSMRNRSQRSLAHAQHARDFDEELEGEYPVRARAADAMDGAGERWGGVVGGAREVADQAKQRVGALAERATHGAEALRSRVTDAASHYREQASELSHEAREQLRNASMRTRDFAEENPLLVGAIAVAAGVGVGLLLPHTTREDRLLGQTRDRLLGDARGLFEDARETARETAGQVGQRARETAQELRNTISDSRISH